MSAIPFGFVGAIIGHMVLGYELSIMSMFGVIALTGVVVNDSLVLIDATNRYRADGFSALEAVTRGGSFAQAAACRPRRASCCALKGAVLLLCGARTAAKGSRTAARQSWESDAYC